MRVLKIEVCLRSLVYLCACVCVRIRACVLEDIILNDNEATKHWHFIREKISRGSRDGEMLKWGYTCQCVQLIKYVQ